MLEKALAMAPRLAKAHYFLGTALKTLGRYDEALDHLRVAAAQYPRDRVVLNQIGRIQFLQRRFDEAIATLQQVLLVDPEDLQAHYNLMLSYQGAGNAALAAREQALYTRFKADETAQAITGPYRLKSPVRQRRAAADSRARTDADRARLGSLAGPGATGRAND